MPPQGVHVEPRKLLKLVDTCNPQRGSHVPFSQTPGEPSCQWGDSWSPSDTTPYKFPSRRNSDRNSGFSPRPRFHLVEAQRAGLEGRPSQALCLHTDLPWQSPLSCPAELKACLPPPGSRAAARPSLCPPRPAAPLPPLPPLPFSRARHAYQRAAFPKALGLRELPPRGASRGPCSRSGSSGGAPKGSPYPQSLQPLAVTQAQPCWGSEALVPTWK